jgi:hypothetical protein
VRTRQQHHIGAVRTHLAFACCSASTSFGCSVNE